MKSYDRTSQEGVKSIVIVGGGSSGWMSASYLTKKFPELSITVIEAPSIPKIGVGEATVPNFQSAFWDVLGIPEETWVRKINASFKLGIKFVNWSRTPSPDYDDCFHHLFGIVPNCQDIPLSLYWAYLYKRGKIDKYDLACYEGTSIAEGHKSPRRMNGERTTHYAWHFDANLLADYLKELSLSWGVSLLEEQVVDLTKDDKGFIRSVETKEGRLVRGDLFVDCTGLRSVLIGGFMEEPFIDMSDRLLCNSAVATTLPRERDIETVSSVTTSTALSAGWVWSIPLRERNGFGYVFSDNFLSMDDATVELARKINVDPDSWNWKKIRFRTGRRRRSWVRNCVAIGLSGNFIEPLESSALYLTYAALFQLARFFPVHTFDQQLADRFNEETNYSYDDCMDFIQMHYVTTKRDDTAFWRANQTELRLSASCQRKLEMYKNGAAVNSFQGSNEEYYGNFELEFRNFWTVSSYYAVLSGMNYFPEKYDHRIEKNHSALNEALKMMERIKKDGQSLAEELPGHYEYLKAFHMMG